MTVAYLCDRCGQQMSEPAVVMSISRAVDYREAQAVNLFTASLFGGSPPRQSRIDICETCEGQLTEFMSGKPLHADWLEADK